MQTPPKQILKVSVRALVSHSMLSGDLEPRAFGTRHAVDSVRFVATSATSKPSTISMNTTAVTRSMGVRQGRCGAGSVIVAS